MADLNIKILAGAETLSVPAIDFKAENILYVRGEAPYYQTYYGVYLPRLDVPKYRLRLTFSIPDAFHAPTIQSDIKKIIDNAYGPSGVLRLKNEAPNTTYIPTLATTGDVDLVLDSDISYAMELNRLNIVTSLTLTLSSSQLYDQPFAFKEVW
ncbi:MAG: hypothetical protein KatS3mg104_2956 [Phycisphaerae bacterium]|nr:MAG: hypothetical protein KatS3mg104_2956 [Phycisphaerae bacterium]